MRIIPFIVASMIAGCGNQPMELGQQVDQNLKSGAQADGKGRAFVAANAAIATQMALYHVLAAITQASQADLGAAKPLATLGAVDPDSLGTYQVDVGASSGTVKTLRKGQASVDLAFTFSRVEGDHGFTYDVPTVTGTCEGYDVAIAPIVMRFERLLGANGQELVNADGTHSWNVELSAGGQLSYHGDTAARLDMAGFDLAWPLPAAGTQVGTLTLSVPGADATFTGVAFVGADVVTTKAVVKLSAGAPDYALKMNGGGLVEITPI
ncbi:MAG: hypothetical protein JWM80_870 [Cyanobacteria bacterium RYN_339]|nr:hypothetical protein [Cyanobacteria bacterium RYN_339]